MFRVYQEANEKPLEFFTYNEFANYRVNIARDGYKVSYAFTVRLTSRDYIYCYQLRRA